MHHWGSTVVEQPGAVPAPAVQSPDAPAIITGGDGGDWLEVPDNDAMYDES